MTHTFTVDSKVRCITLPDTSSVGLFRVGGIYTVTAVYGDHLATTTEGVWAILSASKHFIPYLPTVYRRPQ